MRSNTLLYCLTAAFFAAAPIAAAGPESVKGLVDAGVILPFENIRTRVIAQTRGDYVGAQYDESTRCYRFRFLVDGNVVNIDVDARTGQRVRVRQSF